jgi:hypothetical protein
MDISESVLRIYYIAVIISALITLVESIAMLFTPSVLFRYGIRIKTFHGIRINLESFEIGREYKTDHAKFVRLSKNSCLLSRRFNFWSSAFSVKSEILHTTSETVLIWRIPFGQPMFFSLWLLGWISPLFSIFQLTANQILTAEFAFSISILLLSTLLFLFFCCFALKSAQNKAKIAFSEILRLSLHKKSPVTA